LVQVRATVLQALGGSVSARKIDRGGKSADG